MTPTFAVRPLQVKDRDRVRDFVTQHWGAATVVAHGVVYTPDELAGFAATRGDEIVGLLTFHVRGGDCEIVTLDSTQPGAGIGSALIDAIKAFARANGCRRLWLVTASQMMFRAIYWYVRIFYLTA